MLKRALVASIAAVTLLLTPGIAQAWDLVHDRNAYGRVAVRAWTRNYNKVAYVVDYTGRRISAEVRVDCNSGATFNRSWSDTGGRFRFVLRGLGNEGRCDHVFRVVGRRSTQYLQAAIYAEG